MTEICLDTRASEIRTATDPVQVETVQLVADRYARDAELFGYRAPAAGVV
jgi:hypothetical protein